jgi:hypothetical protein
MMKFILGIVLGASSTYLVLVYPARAKAALHHGEDATRDEAVSIAHTGEKAASKQLEQLAKRVAP